MPEGQRKAFISSTSIDLPEHRKQVAEACLRLGYLPVGMEQWPAQDADAETVCLKQVDGCELFIGVYAFRYGWIPAGHDQSISELEYQRAKDRGIPRLLFFADIKSNWSLELVDMDENGARLKAFKQRIGNERVGNFFTTPADLRGLVIHALSEQGKPADPGADFRPAASLLPAAPEPYIAHPYSLMQSRRLIGREAELTLLTDWVAKPGSAVYQNPILSFIAIGGMGKSALTWHFFNQIAPNEMRPLAGRLWWSFYERNAGFEEFVPHALAYCAGRPLEEIRKLDLPSQMEQLWQVLNTRPYLLALDGLERILLAYHRLDAPRMLDDDLDEATAHRIAAAHGLPESAGETYLARHRLRACIDPRAGRFLQDLTQVGASRVLVSSRLYPAELQTRSARPIPGSFVYLQPGLGPEAALVLWREQGVSGARDELVPLFQSCGHHPLLIQTLAGEVADYRPAPGDYAAWRRAHPDFNPAAQLDLRQRQSHILQHALAGLDTAQRQVLHILAGFRMPTGYDTLRELLVGPGHATADEGALDRVLNELEDRGLLGWERRGNRYDLHPIVRGVVWGGLGEEERRGVLSDLSRHFAAQPMVEDWNKVESLADLEPAMELYDKLIGLGHYQEAFELFRDRLEDATLYRLSAARLRLELLRALFPHSIDLEQPALPRLEGVSAQSYAMNSLAAAYQLSGLPGAAVGLFRQMAVIDEREGDKTNLAVGLLNLSDAQRFSGALQGAECSARRALGLTRGFQDEFAEAVSLYMLGNPLAARGEATAADRALVGATLLFQQRQDQQGEGNATAYCADLALQVGLFQAAHELAERAGELARVHRLERDFIRAARLQGAAALGLGEFTRADERLHHALQRARAVDLAEEELPALIALAELRRRQDNPAAARDYLDQVWEAAERGPYPLFHADALNVLAQIERDAGHVKEAITAATRAYELSWCDGPPYAYHWGILAARAHLRALSAPEPDLPAFDPSQHEPMPEVEIEPSVNQANQEHDDD